ncbi:23S rRNA (adenine(2030)-N(6))-methyltransferase RlmJ [Aestuariirhabdus litorea]|uniref:Ribosomal RNA large subunit methyltransferase J n=1 Tax=Aestuariirhabdus litorea TaxID=2528527 RepID=A0A3P3VQZ6_9GAMM|nr:23S rRNA (adenine(2030)-N(6))-methyltransferase RlmJ [Aestuariirhabdus litorea]RRJ83949.1 23S rRNA (adenine(2030)-N(6))-methyltransferase RlmJ [Aestuariirhabdus litorea]RWW97169.1 23S rRNA (adenine(2030)-N(6))-methyltransferase RlmJ [Endozoicomonadaceae bacterium GTF-13]
MLSYRHSFHAGNFADLLKHIVLVEVLEHLCKKEKPFDYIDTHAGAGLYNLASAEASKLVEYRNGIGRLIPSEWPQLARYFEVVNALNPEGGLRFYPGSPLIARQFLRARDNAWLYELHPEDVERLKGNTRGNRRIRVFCEDGLKGLQAHLPPASRRALVLIDPSYELKSDYEQVVKALQAAHRKFATGVYALWYPVVERERINQLETSLQGSGIRNIQRFELGLRADTEGRGMTASGMILINPPWGLFDKLAGLLPKLAQAVGEQGEGNYRCDTLVEE